jgi:chitinase
MGERARVEWIGVTTMAAQFGFLRTSDWGVGYVGQVTITADVALNGWTLAFDAPFGIDSIWGADIVSQQGGRTLVRGTSWNATAPAGGSLSFGFTTAQAFGADPTGFILAGPAQEALPPPAPPSVSVADVVVSESGLFAVFTLTLSHAATSEVSVRFATAEGSARAGLDFTALSGGVTFAAGETGRQVRVALANDALIEQSESFGLRLTAATGASIADGSAVATVIDDDAPRIAVSDARRVEGNSGQAGMTFIISLDRAATSTVAVQYTTVDGTALAGADYTARSGTISFAAGQTQKTITVAILGDRLVEADETLLLRLSNPTRAVLADAEGTGTIVNNDLPKLSVHDALAVTEADPDAGAAGLVGVLSTRGGDIIDATGAAVKIAAVNWFGMEGTTFAPHGLHTRNWQDMMDQMKEVGFNAIRLPFSAQAVLDGGTPNGIDFHLNPDLAGLSPLQIMDAIIDYAGEIGLRIILDHHRSSAGNGPNGNGLWTEGAYTTARWIGMWEDLAARYAGNPTVIGADLSNEPHGASWSAWAGAAEAAGNAALAKNPDWLIFVEGVGEHAGQHYWWGGNLMGAEDRPVVLSAPDKLVYSAHDYPNSVYPQSFFSSPDFPANLPAIFDRMWGYLWHEGTAPVLVGEFGSRLTDPKDLAWAQQIVAYMSGDIDADGDKDVAGPGASFAYWSWNPNSGDTGGILADDWRTVLASKVALLDPILPDAAAPPRQAAFEVTLSEPVTAAVTVNWRTAPGTANATDYVHASGVLTFLPGQSSRTILVDLVADDLVEATENFRLELFSAQGATIGDGLGIGRILDDDAAAALRSGDWVL